MSTIKEQAIERLGEILRPGQRVYTSLTHEGRNGMSRTIKVSIRNKDGMEDITHLLEAAGLGKQSKRHGGIFVTGCGMDMGFWLVYQLGRTLYPKGVSCTGHAYTETKRNGRRVLGCRSNDHSNGERVYRRGKKHPNGGYAFDQCWA